MAKEHDVMLLDDEGFNELPDGSVEIIEETVIAAEDSFSDNLAEKISESALYSLALEYCDLVVKDKDARKRRDDQYEEGLRRTGLGDDAPGGAEFNGASRVVHPVLAEACVDFSSRTVKELFPASGPVKSQIVGLSTPNLVEKAERKTKYMNWQLTSQIKGYRAELDQLLIQLPMGGSQYQKWFYDDRLGRADCQFVPIDDMILPFSATDFYTSPRATHRQQITKQEFRRRVNSGLYRDVFITEAGAIPEQTASAIANDKIEGREDDGYNEDGLRAVLEIYTWLDLESDDATGGNLAPYILTIDEDTQKVLSLYRNWAEGDEKFEKLDWFVEWRFIPWRGAYAIGLPHLIGGLSAALTGALRAILDSAHINNAASMLKLKSGRVVGQNKEVNVTQITEIEGPAGIDDVRKIAMPMPFNPPSPVLMQLLTDIYGLAKGVVATANDALSSVGDRTPVGTTMALIEQGSPTYSAIHGRLHESHRKSLEILHRINGQFLDNETVVKDLGGLVVYREDFTGPMDVAPVSDPTIFSEAQRFAQVQALVQMSQDPSVPWNKQNIYRRVLKRMRIEAPDEILPEVKNPLTADVYTENSKALEGFPLQATPEQDHMAHIFGHMTFLSSPLQMQNPLVPPPMLAMMLQHIGEHINMLQRVIVRKFAQIPTEQGFAAAEAAAQQALMQLIGPTLQQITALQQQIQAKMPPPQLPPEAQVKLQAAQMENQRKTQADQADIGLRQQELQQEAGVMAAEMQFKQQLETLKFQMDQQEAQFNQFMAQQQQILDKQAAMLAQEVEMQKNREDNRQHQMTELMKNRDDNMTNLTIAQTRETGQMDMDLEKASADAILDVLKMEQSREEKEADRQLKERLHKEQMKVKKEKGDG